jgi:membrane protein YdbS with pleckstrin-like domain
MTDRQAGQHSEHHLRTPTTELPHEEKLRRQARHMQVLTGVMLLVLAMLIYSALFDLDNWSEWVVFGAICSVAVGTMIAVSTRSRQ